MLFGSFFSLFLMRKRLSSGQKWFLKPYFPLIRGMFVFRSGLRFLFRALDVLEPRVRKRPLSLTSFLFQMETEGEECGDDNGLIPLGEIDLSLNQDATWLLTSSFIDPCSGEYVHQPAAS